MNVFSSLQLLFSFKVFDGRQAWLRPCELRARADNARAEAVAGKGTARFAKPLRHLVIVFCFKSKPLYVDAM